MAPPFRLPPSAASIPDGNEFIGCASGCDAWAPHHVRLNSDSCRLCSSCVLLCNPDAFCSACLLLLSPAPGAYAAASHGSHVDFLAGLTAACARCGVFVAHLSCLADPCSFVCLPCAAAADRRPFSYEYDLAGGGRRTLDERSARVILAAALLSHESALRAAAAACEKAERSVQEAAAARKQARAMIDAACRAAEAEARDAKEQVTQSATATATATATELPKKKTLKSNEPKKKAPKSNEASRDRDKLLKFNTMQQPALAFAAAAAAAASSVPLPTPSSRLDQNPVKQEAMPLPMPSSRLGQNQMKQEARGSADRAKKDDFRALFGTLQ